MPKHILDKRCFIQCPPERCNCKNGNVIAWELQEARWAKIITKVAADIDAAKTMKNISSIDKDSY